MTAAAPGLGPFLLTGATGQVGSALVPMLQELGEVAIPGRAELDLAEPDSIRACVRRVRPQWIINPAAYTAVDRAESEPALAARINSDAVRVLGEEAAALAIPVVHFSSDYVFNGSGDTPWREEDPTDPLNVYGASKLAGEQALAASGAAHLILRTSWVYAATGQNFLRTMLRLGREREVLRIVDDQVGAPTSARDLAALVTSLIHHVRAAAAEQSQPVHAVVREYGGLLHAAASGLPTTWCGFARAIFAHAATARPGEALAVLEPIPTSAYPTPATRPHNSRLCCDRLQTRFGVTLPPWQQSLAGVMAEVLDEPSFPQPAAPNVRPS